MNILFVTQSYLPVPGGVANSIEAFRKEFVSKGHRVYIIAPEMDNQVYDPFVIRIKSKLITSGENTPPMQVITRNPFFTLLEKLNLPTSMQNVLDKIPVTSFNNILDKIRPLHIDIIHSHIAFHLGEMAYSMALHLGIPIFYTAHTSYNFYKHRFGVDKTPIDADLAAVYFINKCSGTIYPTEAFKKELVSKGAKSNSIVIPTGINNDLFRKLSNPARHYFTKDKFVIGTVSRLDKEKNLDLLYKIMFQIMTEKSEVSFLCVGQGGMKEQGINLFSPFSSRATFTGSLKGQNLVDAYNEMDIFLFTSVSETQGLVISEAQFCGCTVVASDCEVNKEVTSDSGFICKSIDDYIFAIKRIMIMTKALRQIQLEKTLQNVNPKYSIKYNAQKLTDYYEGFR